MIISFEFKYSGFIINVIHKIVNRIDDETDAFFIYLIIVLFAVMQKTCRHIVDEKNQEIDNILLQILMH